MYAIIVLIIISLTVALGFLVSFIWAVKNNQYEDDYTPSVRMLFDDQVIEDKLEETKIKQENK